MKKLTATLLVLILLFSACGKQQNIIEGNSHVTYEIFVGGFYDSDKDGMGDLNGVTQKLDYIKTLGADSIWLMPIMPSDTYHKYDVKDFYDIDSDYGSMEEFENLLETSHKKGIKIIIDLPVNHTASNHPWFISAKENGEYKDYYNFGTENLSGYSKLAEDNYYEARFWSEMPDLNLDNPNVRQEIENIAKFWLDKGVDGFRLDAVTSYYTGSAEKNTEFLTWFNSVVKSCNPNAYIVAEAWTTTEETLKYYQSQTDSFFNFTFAGHEGEIVKAVNSQRGENFTQKLISYNNAIKSVNPNAVDGVFLSNHDMARSAGFLGYDRQKQNLAAAIYLLMPGQSFVYYGEELSMNGSGQDENKRLAVNWADNGVGNADNPQGSTQTNNAQPAQRQIKDKSSLYTTYKEIILARKEYSQIYFGDIAVLENDNSSFIAYTLEDEKGKIAILHNLSKESQTINLKEKTKILKTLNGKAEQKNNSITAQPFTTIIISIEE